jgi:hypothetical protein
MIHLLALLALQQGAYTTPPSGDTVGYWQQRVGYRIVATLDETAQRLRARAELTYVNNSPDTLRAMYVHQYLNAFRPASAWSRADQREGRVRFQSLREPDSGYERFTAAPTVNGVPVRVEYPGAPDSTVGRFALPRPLAPRDSLRVTFEWDARPSTLPRRQGRRGRHWDLAQWYPKVAVYDRGGWQLNALRPAGEFYGEFGTYDVTLVVRDDQVIGATGVPVSGDPGWEMVKRGGDAYAMARAYDDVPDAPLAAVPAGFKAVRFVARDVHHFAWSASPDYRYEGGRYVREGAENGGRTRVPTWDTVAVHVLYRPGDDTTWGGGRAVRSTIATLRWLESIYGPYAYPQMTNLHRLDGGGTEFPMMMMNGSPSAGLILHEGGHVWTYGILANNEWRSGWMDEGLTSYQTSWALGLTPQERARSGRVEPPARLPEGYRINALAIPRRDSAGLGMLRLELLGRTEPIGTVAHEFREFTVYNAMIYDRAEMMFGQLRDLIGDDAFRRFLHDYYHRWALKHVDERAMRASARRSSGRDLAWFFDEWVHHVGLVDYSLRDAAVVRASEGRWLTRALVTRRGEYRHAMPVGVRTRSGWTFARANALADRDVVEVVTTEQPLEVRLDPLHTTVDWDWRNDKVGDPLFGRARFAFDWPFLDQADRDRSIVALMPMAWYSEPGGITFGARARGSYLTWLDRRELGVAVAPRAQGPFDASAVSQLQVWARLENPYLPLFTRPLVGYRGGIAFLDGIAKLDASRSWDLSPFFFARGPRIAATAAITSAQPSDRNFLPELWTDEGTTDLSATAVLRLPLTGRVVDSIYARVGGVGGYADGSGTGVVARGYGRLEAELHGVAYSDTLTRVWARVFAGGSANVPAQRALYAASRDPISTFENHFYRPRGALLKQLNSDVSHELAYLPLGGAGLRGYGPELMLDRVLATNVEARRRLTNTVGGPRGLALWGAIFADVAVGSVDSLSLESRRRFFADVGPGASLRGRLFDRDLQIRLDVPLYAHGRGRGAPSVFVAFNDLW